MKQNDFYISNNFYQKIKFFYFINNNYYSKIYFIANQGIVYYWPMNGSPKEIVSGNDMTLVTNAEFTADRFGNENSALKFSLGYATVPTADYFDPKTGFTVIVWIYLLGLSHYQRIFDFGKGEYNNNVMLAFNGGTAQPLAYILCSNYDYIRIDGNTNVNLREWSHVSYTYNAGTISLYLNGNLIGTATGNSCPEKMERNSNFIGKSNWNGDGLLNAILDDFKIYNRPLNNDEIMKDFQYNQFSK